MPPVAKDPMETEEPPVQTTQTPPPIEEPTQEPPVQEETKPEEKKQDNPIEEENKEERKIEEEGVPIQEEPQPSPFENTELVTEYPPGSQTLLMKQAS